MPSARSRWPLSSAKHERAKRSLPGGNTRTQLHVDPFPVYGDRGNGARITLSDGIEVDGLTFSLAHIWRGEAVLRISGGADERVTDSDAFFRAWHPLLRPQPLVPEAERTARACEEWTREVMRRLDGERLNVITLKWFGRPRAVPSFLERHGVTGTFAADSAFLRGLGSALGLEAVDAPESDDPVADLAAGRYEALAKA